MRGGALQLAERLSSHKGGGVVLLVWYQEFRRVALEELAVSEDEVLSRDQRNFGMRY